MASSGSFLSSGWTSSSDTVYLKFSFEIVSQSAANNESKIAWKLAGERKSSGYINAGGFKVIIDGETEYAKSTSYRIALYNGTVIASGTKTLKHESDGTCKFEVYVEGGIYYYAVNCTGSKVFTLDTIARASTISSAGDITLGGACKVKWTPFSESFRYKLKFALGSWSHTTGAIHPNKTSEYTYSAYKLLTDLAEYIPNSKTGTVKVTLYTYSDTNGTKQLGSADDETFTVTVPSNSSTEPTVTMALSPVSSLGSAFDGLYIQGKTKVKATLSATGKYDATIKAYSMKTEGVRYDSGDDYTSGYLSKSGDITVYGYAEDSRGITGETSQAITVIAYSKPKIQPASGESEVIAARCDASGNFSDSGTYLKIKAKRSYSPVTSGGVQKNFCKIRYRYKADGGSYSSWTTILAGNSLNSDEIVTGALLGGALSVDTSYRVQVVALDDVGEYGSTTITVPTDKVYMHRDKVRRSLSFGKYIEEDQCFDIAEDITLKARGPIQAIGGGNVDILTLGTKLTATADAKISLNDQKTPGNYYSPNAENSQYISGSPYSAGGFGLTVRQLQTTGYLRQELFYGRTTWIRHWDGTVWSDWWRYQTTTVPETASVDYVTETGVSGGWTYKKWKGGTYEMFGTFEVTPTGSAIRETLYRTENMTIEVPFTISSAYVSGSAVGYYCITNGGISGNSKITLRLMSDREFSTTTAIEVRLTVVGTYA